MASDDDTTIGRGGVILVVLSGAVTFGVLRGLMHYDLVPSGLFALAIALIVLLVLYRLAQEVNRYDDEAEGRTVRKLVPSSSELGMRMGDGPTVPAAVAVPVGPEAFVSPQRPSTLVRPLAEVASPPVILADPVEDAAPVARTAAAAARPKAAAKPKAEPKGKTAKAKADPKPAPAVEAKPKAAKTAKPKVAKSAEPQGLVRLKAPRKGKPDDLQEIEGIGPALEKLVNSLGFYHFDQIAAWTEADVALVDAEMKTFKGRITRDKWVEQAKIIVSEGLEAFRERAGTNDY